MNIKYKIVVPLLLLNNEDNDWVHCLAATWYWSKYFAKSKSLFDPNGPLSSKLKPEASKSANRKVSAILASTGSSSLKDDRSEQPSRGSYMKFIPEQKVQVARYVLESVINERSWDILSSGASTWRRVPSGRGRWSTWKDCGRGSRLSRCQSKHRSKTRTITAACRRTRHSSAGLCGEHMKTRWHCKHCQLSRWCWSHYGRRRHLAPGKDWAKSLLSRMDYVKRKATTKEEVVVEACETIKASFLDDVYCTVVMEDIPRELIINWDHTGLHYVPVSSRRR